MAFVRGSLLALLGFVAGAESIESRSLSGLPTTSNPATNRALSSMFILQDTSNKSPTSQPCVAMQLAPTYLLTSASCDTTGKTARLLSTQAPTNATESPTSWSLNATGPSFGIRNSSSVVGSSYRIVELQKPIPVSDASRSPLSLPVGLAPPSSTRVDENGTLLIVDLDVMQVKVAQKVIFIDKSYCKLPGSVSTDGVDTSSPRPTSNSSVGVGNTANDKACVVPGRNEDQKRVSSKQAWFFVVHHLPTETVSSSPGNSSLVLLGVGTPLDQRDAAHHVVSWLSVSASDPGVVKKQFPDVDWVDMAEESRILGGHALTSISQYQQFVVGLRTERLGRNHCVGSLIAPNFVLTAAHCGYIGNVEVKWASIGSLEAKGDHGEIIAIRRLVRQPGFHVETFAHDVMLVELQVPSFHKPVLLETGKYIGDRGTILGYGVSKTLDMLSFSTLRKLDVRLGPNNVLCGRVLGATIDDSLMCATAEEGQGVCRGDAGGPLLINAGTSQQRLIGITSRDTACGKKPTLFATVSTAAKFIKSIAKVGTPKNQSRSAFEQLEDEKYESGHVRVPGE